MKITDIKFESYMWPRHTPITNGLYTYTHSGVNIVTVETDAGISGLGLCSGISDSPEVASAIIENIKIPLIGKGPFDTEKHWHSMWKPKLVGRRGITTRVIGGIDIALWDLKGRILEQPIYKLLGGFTDKIPAYIAGGYYEEGKGLKELADEMRENVDLGADAVKMKIGGVSINEDVKRVKAVRDAIGPDIKLMVDANNAYRHYQAIEIAKKMEEFDIFWFEEPVEPDDYEGSKLVTQATSIPVAAGENEYTRYGFRDMINSRCVDILQPDALVLGGITEYMKVAALAQSNDMDLAPHGAQELHIHLVCAVSNGLILEFYRDSVDPMWGKCFTETIKLKDGYVSVPQSPGLGVELNTKELEKFRVV